MEINSNVYISTTDNYSRNMDSINTGIKGSSFSKMLSVADGDSADTVNTAVRTVNAASAEKASNERIVQSKNTVGHLSTTLEAQVGNIITEKDGYTYQQVCENLKNLYDNTDWDSLTADEASALHHERFRRSFPEDADSLNWWRCFGHEMDPRKKYIAKYYDKLAPALWHKGDNSTKAYMHYRWGEGDDDIIRQKIYDYFIKPGDNSPESKAKFLVELCNCDIDFDHSSEAYNTLDLMVYGQAESDFHKVYGWQIKPGDVDGYYAVLETYWNGTSKTAQDNIFSWTDILNTSRGYFRPETNDKEELEEYEKSCDVYMQIIDGLIRQNKEHFVDLIYNNNYHDEIIKQKQYYDGVMNVRI